MRIKIFLIVLFLYVCSHIHSQVFKIVFESGLGTYSMTDLKEINSEVQKIYPFNTKVVSDFPPYFYYEPGIMLKSGKISLGLVYSFQSAGSRVSVKDYSGEYRYDMKVNSNSPGIYWDVEIWSKNNFELSLYSTFKVAFSKLRTNEYFILLDSLIRNDFYNFRAKTYNCEPGIRLTRSLGFFTFGIDAGYSVDLYRKAFHKTENKEILLINPGNQMTAKPNWNGFRFGISAIIHLNNNS